MCLYGAPTKQNQPLLLYSSSPQTVVHRRFALFAGCSILNHPFDRPRLNHGPRGIAHLKYS